MKLYSALRSAFAYCVLILLSTAAWSGSPENQHPPKATTLTEPVGLAEYFQMFAGLFFIVLLIVGMAWLVRRLGRFQNIGPNALRVIASLSMGQREKIVLLQVGETQLLVGVAPGQVRTLHKLEEPIEAPQDTRLQSGGFAEKLAAVLNKQEPKS